MIKDYINIWFMSNYAQLWTTLFNFFFLLSCSWAFWLAAFPCYFCLIPTCPLEVKGILSNCHPFCHYSLPSLPSLHFNSSPSPHMQFSMPHKDSLPTTYQLESQLAVCHQSLWKSAPNGVWIKPGQTKEKLNLRSADWRMKAPEILSYGPIMQTQCWEPLEHLLLKAKIGKTSQRVVHWHKYIWISAICCYAWTWLRPLQAYLFPPGSNL